MLRDKCDGLTRVRNPRRSDSASLACVATSTVARETAAGRDAALLGDGDGTHCRVRAERLSPIDARTRELALRPTTTQHADTVDSMTLFAREVMPRLQDFHATAQLAA